MNRPGELAFTTRGDLLFQSHQEQAQCTASEPVSRSSGMGSPETGGVIAPVAERWNMPTPSAHGGYGGQKETRPRRGDDQRQEYPAMRCGTCKGEHATVTEVRDCSGKKEDSQILSSPPTAQPDTPDNVCGTPGCNRRVARDAAGEWQPMCSRCHAAGLQPDAPNARRDYTQPPPRTERPGTYATIGLAAIRQIREELTP